MRNTKYLDDFKDEKKRLAYLLGLRTEVDRPPPIKLALAIALLAILLLILAAI